MVVETEAMRGHPFAVETLIGAAGVAAGYPLARISPNP
jgi:hypothetical protein